MIISAWQCAECFLSAWWTFVLWFCSQWQQRRARATPKQEVLHYQMFISLIVHYIVRYIPITKWKQLVLQTSSSFTRMLVFFLNVKVQHLFKLTDLKNYVSPKHNGPTFQLAVELVLSKALFISNVDRQTTFHASLYKSLYTSWEQDSDEWFSSVVLHSAGSQSSPVWFA